MGDDQKSKYTEEELEEYRQVFALFDTDGSGAIGNDELGVAMRSMGLNPTEEELHNLVTEVDVDGNGEIDFDEFCMVMKRMTTKKETADEEIIKSCFAVFDQDRNGIISEVEFKTVFREIGGFTEDKIDEVFREVDVAGNGQIDYEEFAQMVRNYLLEDENEKNNANSNSSYNN